MTRAVMWGLLAIVASSSAVLSFAALRDLAILCSFHERLSFLLPLVVDAGAAAGCLVWLSPKDVTTEARRFARTLTFVLLASSVAGNAIVHGLSAYGLRPHWTLVVAVSGVAPAVLGAVVHLSVLVGRTDGINAATDGSRESTRPGSRTSEPDRIDADDFQYNGPKSYISPPKPAEVSTQPSPVRPKRVSVPAATDTSADLLARARELMPLGRLPLAEALGVSPYKARTLLKALEAEQAPRNGHRVLEDVR